MGKTVLVTGATGGLGWSYAKYFAREGWDVILTGRKETIAQRGEELRQKHGVRAETLRLELGEKEGVDALLKALEGRRIDALVNNAGYGHAGKFIDTDDSVIENMLYLHTTCAARLCRALGKPMAERGEGIIINISSAAAFAPAPNSALYTASKRCLLHLTEALHVELAPKGVRVQAVCPGMIDTDFHTRMGVDTGNNWRHLLPFRSPDAVCADAMKDFKRGKVVSVPDLGGKALRQADRHLPRGLFYRILGLVDRKLMS